VVSRSAPYFIKSIAQRQKGRAKSDLPGVMFLVPVDTLISNSALLPASYQFSIGHSAASR
jgi:hypothetical protein